MATNNTSTNKYNGRFSFLLIAFGVILAALFFLTLYFAMKFSLFPDSSRVPKQAEYTTPSGGKYYYDPSYYTQDEIKKSLEDQKNFDQ